MHRPIFAPYFPATDDGEVVWENNTEIPQSNHHQFDPFCATFPMTMETVEIDAHAQYVVVTPNLEVGMR
jgi:hypothetical protein